jgi:indolepyruvate ferredoxin oxidoreductase
MVARAGGSGRAPLAQTLEDIVEKRAAFLAAYQDVAYAARYRERIATIREAEERAVPGSSAVTEAAARNLFKLMAIKDEYEVARLYTDGAFMKQLSAEFESYEKLEFHLAPPILGRKGSDGMPRKSRFGAWMMTGFSILARFKRLRGTAFDIFGYSEERRLERRLLARYEADLELVRAKLAPGRIEAAAALLSVPALIRGFGHVKQANVEKADGERQRLIERLEAEPAEALKAAE